MSYLNGRLTAMEESLTQLGNDTNTTDVNLDALTQEAQQLEQTVRELRQQVYDAKNANLQGEEP